MRRAHLTVSKIAWLHVFFIEDNALRWKDKEEAAICGSAAEASAKDSSTGTKVRCPSKREGRDRKGRLRTFLIGLSAWRVADFCARMVEELRAAKASLRVHHEQTLFVLPARHRMPQQKHKRRAYLTVSKIAQRMCFSLYQVCCFTSLP